MPDNPIPMLVKYSRIWSERREKQIAVRVQYELTEQWGCKIYQLGQVEEVE